MAQSRVMDVPTFRERFDRDGWALVQRFITPREVEALRRSSDDLARKGAHLTADASARWIMAGPDVAAPLRLRLTTFPQVYGVPLQVLLISAWGPEDVDYHQFVGSPVLLSTVET